LYESIDLPLVRVLARMEETGIRVEKPEWQGARWAVRMRLHRPGGATSEAGRRARDPWIGADGHVTFRQSVPDDRDWE